MGGGFRLLEIELAVEPVDEGRAMLEPMGEDRSSESTADPFGPTTVEATATDCWLANELVETVLPRREKSSSVKCRWHLVEGYVNLSSSRAAAASAFFRTVGSDFSVVW